MIDATTFELAKKVSTLRGPVPRCSELTVATKLFDLTIAEADFTGAPENIRTLVRERFIAGLADALEAVRLAETQRPC